MLLPIVHGPGRAAPAFLLMLLVGCGSGVYPVEGTVVWEDGTPARELAGANVVFNLTEQMTGSRGYVQPDGSFRLTTHTQDDGALPGEYQVLIVEFARKSLGGPDGTNLAPGVMDSRYSDPSTTDLKATVQPGVNKLTLKVARLKASKAR